MQSVSVTIVTRDEADRIAEAVASAAWADEVLVLDSGSTDDTVTRATAAGARVMVEPWRGYGIQKNRAAELARHDWVLSLDADERIDASLAQAIEELGEKPGPAAFRVRRRNRYDGCALRHWPWGWDQPVRLYDRRRARFSERVVHESVHVDGPIGRLHGVVEHLGARSIDEYRRRQECYARLGAEQAAAEGRRARAFDPALHGAAAFVRLWLIRGGLLNGVVGARHAVASARGTALKYRLLRDRVGSGAAPGGGHPKRAPGRH